MWNGKMKALTFSFDDGVTQDIRLIEILNAYGLKGTFNINSSLLGLPGRLVRNQHEVSHDKIPPDRLTDIYNGHEIAVHSLTHPDLSVLSDETVVYQVESDRQKLSSLAGYEVVGMAYPNRYPGERAEDLIRRRTGVRYARTTVSTHSFDLQERYHRFDPTVYYIDVDKMFSLAEAFLTLEPSTPQLFYIWGHSYELDAEYISWKRFEEFCRMMSGKKDIFYGTNKEVLLP